MSKMARVIIHRVDTPEEADNVLKALLDAICEDSCDEECKCSCNNCGGCKDSNLTEPPEDSCEASKANILHLLNLMEDKHNKFMKELADIHERMLSMEADFHEITEGLLECLKKEHSKL